MRSMWGRRAYPFRVAADVMRLTTPPFPVPDAVNRGLALGRHHLLGTQEARDEVPPPEIVSLHHCRASTSHSRSTFWSFASAFPSLSIEPQTVPSHLGD